MKKVMIVVAAMAMIAFASCKKDSDTVTLRVGVEDTHSSAKEGWYNLGNQVAFENSDLVLINGAEYALTLTDDPMFARADDGSIQYSRFATVNVCSNLLNSPAVMLFPRAAFGEENGELYTELNTTAVAMPMAGVSNIVALGTYYWPLVACIGNLQENQQFNLKNTTALIAPTVKFGSDFIADFNAQYSTHFTSAAKLKVSKVTVTSDQNLGGFGYIELPENPDETSVGILRIYNDPDAVQTVVARPADITREITTSDNMIVLGNIAVPELTTGNLYMSLECTIEENGVVASVKFDSRQLHINGSAPAISLNRNERTSLVADFFSTRSNWNGFTVNVL